MSTNIDKVVKIYKSLSSVPALIGAKLINNNSVVSTVWSQRNIETGQTIKFSKNIGLSNNLSKTFESPPIDVTSELLSAISPSERFRAVLRNLSDKQYLEIWQNYNLYRTVDLNALDAHGDVYTDGELGTFRWSPDESKLLYIAELKDPKAEPFYKRAQKKPKGSGEPEKPKAKGEEYLFVQDWGEQLVGKRKSVIAEYNLEKDEVEVLSGIPDDICPAQVIYSPDGEYLVGIAYKTEPRKLGLIYCANRLSTIFTLDYNGNYVPFALDNKSVKSPVFTPDGQTLIWLQREAGGPHASCMSLMKTSVPLTIPNPSVVVDAVKTEIQTDNGTTFYGLYNGGFIRRCFVSGNRLVVSTCQKNTTNTYLINIASGKITELQFDEGSQIALDVVDDVIVVNRRNFLKQDKLAICKLPPQDAEVPLNWIELTTSDIVESLERCTYKYIDLVQDTNDSVKKFSAIYLGPHGGSEKSVSLVVWPHGGPHAAFSNNLTLEGSTFLALDFAILFINYRGSLGAGQDSVDFLPGKIGQADIDDCLLATKTALRNYPFLNPESVLLCGGSHGGFLVTSLSGQYPDMFKAVVARNPVIDVASMSVISDIPDWCFVESGSEYTQVGQPSEDLLLDMRRRSPIVHAHKVKTPTLLQIGSKDLRVPPHQGLEYYTRLKANGTKVKLNLYEDNHPLSKVPNEMDNIINTILWFQEHL